MGSRNSGCLHFSLFFLRSPVYLNLRVSLDGRMCGAELPEFLLRGVDNVFPLIAFRHWQRQGLRVLTFIMLRLSTVTLQKTLPLRTAQRPRAPSAKTVAAPAAALRVAKTPIAKKAKGGSAAVHPKTAAAIAVASLFSANRWFNPVFGGHGRGYP